MARRHTPHPRDRRLRDVAIATYPAYESAAVELRNHNPAEAEEDSTMGETAEATTETATAATETTEERSAPNTGAGLRVEERTSAPPPRGLAEEFRAAGFPGEQAVVGWDEFRAATWTGSVDALNRNRVQGVDLGADQRYAWPAFIQVPQDRGTTSVDVLRRSARTLPSGATMVRAVDAVTAKPEIATTLELVSVPMKQIPGIVTNIPNVYLEQPAFNSAIETDLRLAVNEGLDELVRAAVAASGFQAPGTDNILVSIRKAITTIRANGYNPDTLLLTPAADEAIDVMVSGITGGTADFVFAPGQFSPEQLFRMNRRVSKVLPASAVVDSRVFGKLYPTPVALARFEADSGTTNRSNVRMELDCAFGTERQNAAVRIAAA